MTDKIIWFGKTSAYTHKHGDWTQNPVSADTPNGVRKVTVLDAQWSTCPIEVYTEVTELWRYLELGNDKYIDKTSLDDLRRMQSEGFTVERWYWGASAEEQKGWVEEEGSVNAIIQYLEEQGVTDDEDVWIHFWW